MTDDKHTVTINLSNARIESVEQARDRAADIREDAPDTEYLRDDATADIDAVIAALEAAKDRGVERVLVNDDGRTRHIKPKVTNNYAQYSAMQPEPGELREWVEL